MSDVLAEGDKTCERSDQRTGTADVDTEQKLAVIVGELREQNGTRYVADALAGQRAEQKNAFVKQGGEQCTNAFHASHVARKNEEANKGQKQRIVDLLQCLAVCEHQNGRDDDQTDPVGNSAEDNGDGQHEQRKVKRGSLNGKLHILALRYGDLFRRNEHKTADDDHDGGQGKGRCHDGEKFTVGNVEVGIQIEVLGIAERGEHTAEIGGDVLHDKGKSHQLLLTRAVQNEKTEGQKGQKRHVVGDQHGADEGDEHQRQNGCAGVTRSANDAMRQNGKKANVFQGTDDSQRAEQTAERFQVEIVKISRVGRNNAGGDDGRRDGNAQHGVFSHPAKNSGPNMMMARVNPMSPTRVSQLHTENPFCNQQNRTLIAHEE